MKLKVLTAILILTCGLGIYQGDAVEAAGEIPPWPLIYTGNVTVGGQPAADGLKIVGMLREYSSIPVEVKEGRMVGLAVGPPDYSYFGETITFALIRGEERVIAEETDLFTNLVAPTLRRDFHLTFPSFPTPTPLPSPTPTQTPLPTATPIATATPIVVGPVVYNGMVVASGGSVPDGTLLTARIGGYTSSGVPVLDGKFISLIIDLEEPDLTGAEVKFYLDGIEARTTAEYGVGPTIRNIDLIFMDLPNSPTSTPIPIPTTPPSPTAVPKPEPQKAESTPTPSSVAITGPVRETPTPIVLVVTATPESSDSEEVQETVLPNEEKGGACGSVREVDPLTGAGNVLAMIGPVLMLVAFRGYRKLF